MYVDTKIVKRTKSYNIQTLSVQWQYYAYKIKDNIYFNINYQGKIIIQIIKDRVIIRKNICRPSVK